jgi:hypothetical protein
MKNSRVIKILSLWPDLRAVHTDVLRARADLQYVSVYRWGRRGSIPSEYWNALLEGARARQIKLTAQDLADAHAACDHDGHNGDSAQGAKNHTFTGAA